MNDYTQSIIARQRMSDLRREAESDRLARRARVHRDGSVSFIRKVGAAVHAGAARLAVSVEGATGSADNRDRLASA